MKFMIKFCVWIEKGNKYDRNEIFDFYAFMLWVIYVKLNNVFMFKF